MHVKLAMFAICVVTSLALASGTTAAAAASQAYQLRPPAPVLTAGAAKVVITPPLSEFPQTALGGFGERKGKPATGVHDDLYSRALVLSNGRTKVALVSTDLLIISPGMKAAVLAKIAGLGFSDQNVLLAATHTHSAPEGMDPRGDLWPQRLGKFHRELLEYTTTRIAQSIFEANAALRPAQLGFAAEKLEGLSRNRRTTGGALLDSTMTVMRVATDDGKPIAMVVNFAAHPTIMGATSFLFSGDWPGALSTSLQERMGDGSVALTFNGDQGDQTHAGAFGSGWERVSAYGKALADKAWQLADGIRMSRSPVLRVHAIMWTLPKARVSSAIASTVKEYGIGEEEAKQRLSKMFLRRVMLQAVRIDDAVLMAVPGEAIAELGLQMKANATAAGAKYPMVIGLANAHIGYILSPSQYAEGGYEAGSSFYGPMVGSILVAQMNEAVRPLFAVRGEISVRF